MRITLFLSFVAAAAAQQEFDLVVYGGTAGGVTTAVAAARHGLRTALLEPRDHIGGMVSGGLSGTDTGKREVIGGMALEFYYRAGLKYDMNRHLQELSWMPEPKVAEAIFREMLKEADVKLFERHRLKEKTGVVKIGNRVTEIVTENGVRFRAKVFADTSYEGDLMAQAKVSYTYGREGISEYSESLAGIRAVTESHQFAVDVPARDKDGRVFPEVSTEPRGTPGSADKRIQAYNFRVIGTNVPQNRIPWPKPENYDSKRYELLGLHLAAMTPYMGRPLTFNEVSLHRIIPNGKVDLNNRNGFSTDYIGKNYGYPEGSYAERERIWKEHVDYQQGFYYFLANDPRVPKSLQEEVRSYGLAKDEYTDTNNWPHQLYVREARRMVSDFVSTQKDLQTERIKPDVIGMGSYASDSHNVQRFINDRGFVENEGDVQVPVQAYQIPYRVLVPKKSEAVNLLVPVCFSSSHIAYSSMRMEPQYMILGHAAGIAAAIAAKGNVPIQDISIAELQAELSAEGAVFKYSIEEHNQALATIRRRFARRPERVLTPGVRPKRWISMHLWLSINEPLPNI